MKARHFVILTLLVALLVAGCDLFTNLKVEDLLGTWEFGTQTVGSDQVRNFSAFFLQPESELIIDLHWKIPKEGFTYDPDDSTTYDEHACFLNGTQDGKDFTGTYTTYDITDPMAISGEFSMSGGKLTMKFTGSGELNGVNVTGGVPQDS